MSNVTVKMKDGNVREFREGSRSSGSYCNSIRYEGAFAIIKDEWGAETAIPAQDIEEVQVTAPRQGGGNMKRIPIEAAKRITNDYEYPEVVIFAYDPISGMQHVTTYGKTIDQCKDAARAGNYLKKALGWPEAECHARPARDKEVIE